MRKKTEIISLRFTSKEINAFEDYVESDPNFEKTSEALRVFCLYGLRFFILQKAAENPEFVSNLEKQFHIQISKPSLENIVNKMEINEIDTFMLKLKDIQNEKINRIIAQEL